MGGVPGVAGATTIVAPWITARAMDTSASRFRGRLAAVEVAAGSLVLVAAPSWPIGAGVLSAVLNIWNREDGFSWQSKVPLGSVAVAGGLALGLVRTRPAGGEIAITMLGGAAGVALISNSYGMWWPFSGASLVGSAVAERRGAARARAAAAGWLAEVDEALAAAERRLREGDDADGLFRVRLARRRLAVEPTATGDTIGEIVFTAAAELTTTSSSIRLDAGDLVTLEVPREDDRRRWREVIVLLMTEAVTHGDGVVDLQLERSDRGIDVRAENALVTDRSSAEPGERTRPPRGQARLRELAEGLAGAAFEPREHAGRYATGFWCLVPRR